MEKDAKKAGTSLCRKLGNQKNAIYIYVTWRYKVEEFRLGLNQITLHAIISITCGDYGRQCIRIST